MTDPAQVESWIALEWAAITSAPIFFLVAIFGVSLIIWLIIWLIFKEQIKAKDATIQYLQERLEGEVRSQEQHSAVGAALMAVATSTTSYHGEGEETEVREGVQAFLPPLLTHQQRIVDELAEFRSEGIHSILNAHITNNFEWHELEAHQSDWWHHVESYLRENFSKADTLHFTRMGIIPMLTFPHTYNEGHAKMLREFVVQDERIREIIDRNIPRG